MEIISLIFHQWGLQFSSIKIINGFQKLLVYNSVYVASTMHIQLWYVQESHMAHSDTGFDS